MIGDRVIYVTSGENCVRLEEHSTAMDGALECTQEEADTRMLLHVKHAIEAGFKTVTIVADDTDVLIICLAFASELHADILMRCGTKNRTRLINIKSVAETIGVNVCKSLIGYHAFSGCDSVSAFAGLGKNKGFNLLLNSEQFQSTFTRLGENWELTESLCSELEKFTCKLYAARTSIASVNELRHFMWIAKKGMVESGQLPPCASTLRQHCLRANYQSAIWRRSLVAKPTTPCPDGHGWKLLETGELDIEWIVDEPAPQSILTFLSCKCRKSCKLPSCPCLSNGLKCTAECSLQTCANIVEDDELISQDSENEESDNEY